MKEYDVLIKNVRTVDNRSIEVAVKDGKIAEVASKINASSPHIIDGKNELYISAGWIDDHVHCNEVMNLYYDSPDEIGIKKGVCTIIDAGSTGADNIERFYENVKNVKTNVYALINIARQGILTQDELSNLENIDEKLIATRLKSLDGFIVGLKARMSRSVVGDNGVKPLIEAKRIQKNNQGIPLMVHIGSAPPNLREICALLEKGDMVTHCFNGKDNNILDDHGKVHDFVVAAQERGVLFDVGHGTDSFSLEVAKDAFHQCFYCQTVSTDIYSRNRLKGPVYDLSTTLEKLTHVGYKLQDLIPMITETPASFFSLKGKGFLEVGYDADITLFKIQNQKHEVVDSQGRVYQVDTKINPVGCLVNGCYYEIGGNHG